MDDKCIFNCEVCGKESEAQKENVPECCGKPMIKKGLPVCTLATDAEHSRLDDDLGDPCDDGRAGN